MVPHLLLAALWAACALGAPQWGRAVPPAPAADDQVGGGGGGGAGEDAAPRVGVLVQGPSVKGLFRDAECLVWALARDPVRLSGRRPASLSVFYTSHYGMLDMAVGTGVRCLEDRKRGQFCASADALNPGDSSIFEDHMVPAGTDVRDWLRTVDVVVVFESVLRSVLAAAHKAGVRRKVLVLNIDWIEPNSLLALYSEIPGLQFWTKGNATQTAVSSLLHDHLLRQSVPSAAALVETTVALVPWSIPDAVLRQDSRKAYLFPSSSAHAKLSSTAAIPPAADPPRRQRQHPQQLGATVAEPVHFLFIAGMGGIGNRRGGDIVLEAFARASRRLRGSAPDLSIQLDFYSVRHPAHYDLPVPSHLLEQPGMYICTCLWCVFWGGGVSV